jgi:hypothetical protein
MDGKRIAAVKARDIRTNEERRFTAPVFIDCTGDGWIGYSKAAGPQPKRSFRSGEVVRSRWSLIRAKKTTMSANSNGGSACWRRLWRSGR